MQALAVCARRKVASAAIIAGGESGYIDDGDVMQTRMCNYFLLSPGRRRRRLRQRQADVAVFHGLDVGVVQLPALQYTVATMQVEGLGAAVCRHEHNAGAFSPKGRPPPPCLRNVGGKKRRVRFVGRFFPPIRSGLLGRVPSACRERLAFPHAHTPAGLVSQHMHACG